MRRVQLARRGPDPGPDPDLTPAAQYTITYVLNGGKLDGQEGTITVAYKAGSVITLPAPTRDGYVFDYWEGSKYNAGDKYTVNGDHTFKAIWKAAEEQGNGSSSQANQGKNNAPETSTAQVKGATAKTSDNASGLLGVLLVAALLGAAGASLARRRI